MASMLPQWIIEKKRDGEELDRREIHDFIAGYTDGSIPDYQMSALAMAIYFSGMNARETADLTVAMMESGKVIDPNRIPGIKVDKHSTGGIGDKISIPLAPLVASCGATVPMISGPTIRPSIFCGAVIVRRVISAPAGIVVIAAVKPSGRFFVSSLISPSNPSDRNARTVNAAVPPGAICRPEGSMLSWNPGLDGLMRRR